MVYTKSDYEVSWHHRLLCRRLDRFASGAIKRLMVFVPPQHGKSELVSRRLPAYLLGRNPAAKIIACSYTADLSASMNRDVQKVLDGDAYRRLFPGARLGGRHVRTVAGPLPLRNSEEFEILDEDGRLTGGYYKSAGVGGGITGRPMDYGLLDDPVKGREQADSPACRENVWGWYNGDFLSRAHGGTSILVTCTRWHEDDLPGRLLKATEDDPKADRWEVVCLPALCEEERPGDPRKPGEPLWPSRHPLALLEAKRASSPYDWASLYQQRPRGAGALEWPDEYFGPGIWFEDWPSDLDIRVIALDPSKGKDSKFGDYSAFVMLGQDREGGLWADADLARRPTPRIVEDGIALYQSFRPQAFAVEANAFQELLGSEFLRVGRERGLVLPMYGITNTINKQVRIRTLGPLLAQGRLRFKGGSLGAKLLVQQLKDWPMGDHDDAPDSLQMSVVMLDYLLGEQEQTVTPQVLRA